MSNSVKLHFLGIILNEHSYISNAINQYNIWVSKLTDLLNTMYAYIQVLAS